MLAYLVINRVTSSVNLTKNDDPLISYKTKNMRKKSKQCSSMKVTTAYIYIYMIEHSNLKFPPL